MTRRSISLALGLALWLGGCGGMKVEDFAAAEPRFRLEEYFAGTVKGWGVFEDRFGVVRRQLAVDIDGSWGGSELVLREDFTFKDGEKDFREWRIRKTGDDAYEGRAADVVGAARGTAAGNAVNWRYTMDMKVGEGTWRVAFDDWMFLQDAEIMINRARVSKWGIAIGELTMVFRKVK